MSEAELRRRLDSVTEELLAAYEELDVLTRVAEIAASTSDAGAVGARILEEAAGLLQAEVGFVLFSDPELSGEEPAPIGITPAERDALRSALSEWLSRDPRPRLMDPFHEGAGVPHAPEILLAVPLRSEGQVLGAIGIGRHAASGPFTAGDLKILSVLGSSAAGVLLQRRNLDLARMARRLQERSQLLKAILAIGREMTSSLDLDRLLHALANLPTRELGFDRCAVLLEDSGRRRLTAVSGIARVDRADAEMRSLERLLEWVAGHGAGAILVQDVPAEGQGPADPAVPRIAEPAEAAQVAAPHMKLSGARSLLALTLRDDQGLLGVLSLESGTPGFVDALKQEGASILANQATVAIRNARLYGEVPFVGLLGPLRAGLKRAGAVPRRRALAWGAAGLALLALLSIVRWPLRVAGEATLMPRSVSLVTARVRGVIREVASLREGDRVGRGTLLARLEAPDLAIRLNEAAAGEQTAVRRATRLEAEGRAADVRLARVEAERWRVEREELGRMLESAELRSPVEGVLLTPRLEERLGELLDVGAVLCTVADTSRLRVEIAVKERDADLLVLPAGSGGARRADLKFDAFPESDYEATIEKVRSAAQLVGGSPALVAEGTLQAEGPWRDALRPGMTAAARVDAGPRPLILVLLRRPYRFLRGWIWL